MADEDLLHQVFKNLGTNVVQALEEKGVKSGDFISIDAFEYRTGTGDEHKLKENILLIEDEEPVRRFMKEALTIMGYSVISAINGNEGLEVFTGQHDEIDLVLLDLTMPEIPGETVMNRILETSPDAKIILVSGQSREELQKYTRAQGLLLKPFFLSELARVVRSVLDE